MEEKQPCQHKWIPNGIVKREVWKTRGATFKYKYGEIAVASTMCEKCGEIKFKREDE